MNNKRILSLMQTAAFPANPNPIRFVSKNILSNDCYVAWIDIMGAAAAMRRSLSEAASKIGKFNAAILMAHNASAPNDEVTIHAMTDGAYVVSKSADAMRHVLSGALANIARVFLSASRENRFVVRCSVAYGEVVTSSTMDKRLRVNPDLVQIDKAVLRNVMLGDPFVTAYAKEVCAPPFGVYVDQSAVLAGFAGKSIWHWWNADEAPVDDFILSFKKSLEQHFAYIEEHYYDNMLSAAKIAEYRAKIRSYFRDDARLSGRSLAIQDPESDAGDATSDDSDEG